MALSLRVVHGTTHHEALDWARRVVTNGGSVSTTTVRAVSDFCASIDRAGLRSKFTRLNLFCGQQLEAALVPLYRASSFGGATIGNSTDTNTNFVGADYVETGANGGLKGDGTTKYLDTGVNSSTALTNTDVHLSVSARDMETSGDRIALGTYSGTIATGGCILDVYASYVSGRCVRIGSVQSGSFPVVSSPGTSESHMIGTRTSDTSLVLYRGGTLAASNTSSQTPAFANASIPVFALWSGAAQAISGRTAARIRMYSIGLGMTASQAKSFSDAVIAFHSVMGRS